MYTLDSYDIAILRELQRDTAISLDILSAKVSLSRNACWRRVQLLESAGVILRRVALLDPKKLDAGLMAFIQVRAAKHSTDWARDFRLAVASLPEIIGAYRTSGDVDYVLQARVPDVAAYDLVYQRLINKVDMNDVSASFVMEEIKATTEIPLIYTKA
ncbi:Lrp/AsnC family transcriptional regulator [Rhizobium sp. SL86]|uniref:Lrp/AsnC family transcriptional regulator n=1 Tax=Rhizobium sp. SL86 TaxID=2995148 RepID=UPI0022745470|nr:Lrp/AsnC family transcriptional regulator [Rhizobium sp. SL86]MCY1667545.1 Lrp/AsnC family transcriptional regulator [Rhizobium sp. SL86]